MRRKRNKTVAQGKPRKIIVEPLEPRTLFSADVVSASLALDLIEDSSPEQHNWLADTSQSLFAVFDDKADAYASENSVLNDYSSSELIGFEEQASEVIADPAPIFEPSRQLIVIDARVDNSDELLQDVLNNAPSGTDFDVIELHEGSDGIEQITSALNAQGDQKYNAVHIIAHGSDAEVLLGSTQLNSANLQQYENELSSWRTDLTLDADILLYGCDVAQTHAGQEFVDQISQWTGADIASSSDLTGHADLGGNWELEYTVGEVETDLPFSLKTTQNWTGTLASGTNSFWLSTQFDIAPGNGGPGLDSWTAQEIVEIGEPNLQLEPTAGTTDGTFSSIVDLDQFSNIPGNIKALHHVAVTQTVDGIALEEGDILFATNSPTTYTSDTTITTTSNDVYLFKPTTPGDYSSGSFSLYNLSLIHI